MLCFRIYHNNFPQVNGVGRGRARRSRTRRDGAKSSSDIKPITTVNPNNKLRRRRGGSVLSGARCFRREAKGRWGGVGNGSRQCGPWSSPHQRRLLYSKEASRVLREASYSFTGLCKASPRLREASICICHPHAPSRLSRAGPCRAGLSQPAHRQQVDGKTLSRSKFIIYI